MNTRLPGPFTWLENFGHSLKSPSCIFRPKTLDDLPQLFDLARTRGLTVTARGAGRSYNDAALNGGGIILDMQGMNRILSWDSRSGIITCEPGVTLCQLWHTVLPDGWWCPVVSGTMLTTLGGCLGANIHGKNNFRLGTIGEHVLQFNAILPTGAHLTCSPKKNADLFHAMIGGLGMLGIFTSITLKMKRVHSGLLNVTAWNVTNLETHLENIAVEAPVRDYIVGWLDSTARGRRLGRGQLHCADYLSEGEDMVPFTTREIEYQTLPEKFFGLVPKKLLHVFMAPFMNNLGVPVVNSVKYLLGSRAHTYRQSHAAFHFLLDYVPNWELAYGDLIQYQSFLPKEAALATWSEMLSLSHRRGLPAYLGVTKRHRPDDFLLSYSVDGFSLALDFKVTTHNRRKLAAMLAEFDRIVVDAGGRFYFAKNSETTSDTTRQFIGEERLNRFRLLKQRCDPDNLLESDLFRRVFSERE